MLVLFDRERAGEERTLSDCEFVWVATDSVEACWD